MVPVPLSFPCSFTGSCRSFPADGTAATLGFLVGNLEVFFLAGCEIAEVVLKLLPAGEIGRNQLGQFVGGGAVRIGSGAFLQRAGGYVQRFQPEVQVQAQRKAFHLLSKQIGRNGEIIELPLRGGALSDIKAGSSFLVAPLLRVELREERAQLVGLAQHVGDCLADRPRCFEAGILSLSRHSLGTGPPCRDRSGKACIQRQATEAKCHSPLL
jgi:hypothetical protein